MKTTESELPSLEKKEVQRVGLLSMLLVVVLGLSANAAVIYNPCDNLDNLSAPGFAPGDFGIKPTGGPDASPCFFFVSRSNNNHLASWNFPDVTVNPGDTFTFDIQNIIALGTAHVDVRYIVDNGLGGDTTLAATSRLTLSTNDWVHVSCNMPLTPKLLKRIDFSVVENTKVIDLDNLTITTIPEPASLALLGLAAIALLRRRR